MIQLIDVSNLAYRNYYGLRLGHKHPVVYGVLKYIRDLGRTLESRRFVFCFDTVGPTARKEIYSNYKMNRMDSPERKAVKSESLLLKDMLYDLGFDSIQVEGAEADDLIAYLVQHNKSKSFVIVSSDSDLNQLLEGDRVIIWNPYLKSSFTEYELWDKYELKPEEWVMFKSIVGCPSDNIVGVNQVGVFGATQYIRCRLNTTHHAFKRIVDAADLIALNKTLVKLPLEGLKIPKPNFTTGWPHFPEKEDWDIVMRKYDLPFLMGEYP